MYMWVSNEVGLLVHGCTPVMRPVVFDHAGIFFAPCSCVSDGQRKGTGGGGSVDTMRARFGSHGSSLVLGISYAFGKEAPVL